METIILIGISIVAIVVVATIIYRWITVYNKFIYWRNKLDEKFANIDIIMQRRLDMLKALAQVAEQYGIHEYKTIKDTIEARSRWSKDTPLNSRVEAVNEIENNFIKLQAVFEKYPRLKADKLYMKIMGSGNITDIERKLQAFRLEYNSTVRKYNERIQRFPRSVVAKVHGFVLVEYLKLGNPIDQDAHEVYKGEELFDK